MLSSSAVPCCTSTRSGTAEAKPGRSFCARISRTGPSPAAPCVIGATPAAKPATIGVTREKPSARASEAASSGAINEPGSMRTRRPVAVVASATVKVLEGQGRRQRTGSMGSHAAVSGARTPGCRSGTPPSSTMPPSGCVMVLSLEQPASARKARSAKRAVFVIRGRRR
ncbi:MAG: hypothetical protein QM820_10570 [Minicystis sp.]